MIEYDLNSHDALNERNETLGMVLVAYREGDEETRERLQSQYEKAVSELTEKNIRLVTQFLGNFSRNYREELKQEGLLKLFQKIPEWDYRVGTLDNFVRKPIYYAMIGEFRRQHSKGFSKLPERLSLLASINTIQFELKNELGRAPTSEEITERYNQLLDRKQRIKPWVVERLGLVEERVCYLGDGDSLEIADTYNSPLEKIVKQEEIDTMMRVVNNGVLRDRERELIIDYYFNGKDLVEIAKEQRVTKKRTSQIYRRAIRKIQEALRDKYPEIKVIPKYIDKEKLLKKIGKEKLIE